MMTEPTPSTQSDWKAILTKETLDPLNPLRVGYQSFTHVYIDGYQCLYRLAIEHLEDSAAQQQSLRSLQALLKKELALKAPALPAFEGDFRVFEYLLQLKLTPASPEPLSVQLVYGPLCQDARHRFEGLVVGLLKNEVVNDEPYRTGEVGYRSLKKQLEYLERLNRLCGDLVADLEPTTQQVFLSLFVSGFRQRIEWFKTLLKAGATPANPLFQDLADGLWRLLRWYAEKGEDVSTPDFTALCHALRAWYTKGATYETSLPYFFQNALLREEDSLCWRPSTFQSWPEYIQWLSLALKQDLMRIQRWGQYLFKAELSAQTPDKTDRYLAIFQQTRAQLTQWSEAAFTFRMHVEGERRKERSYFANFHSPEEKRRKEEGYLSDLEALDTQLLTLREEMHEIQNKWLEDAQTHAAGNVQIAEATACFKLLLNDKRIERLRQVDWLHRTCFAHEQTEGRFAAEMEQRNKLRQEKCFDNYQLKTTYTMTDWVAENLLEAIKAVRPIWLQLHPDKHPLITSVAKYCTEELSTVRDLAIRFNVIWRKGQWFSIVYQERLSIEVGKSTREVDPVEEEPMERVDAPQNALNLSVLQIHKDYLDLMGRQPNLRKRVKSTEFRDMLHSGPDSDQARLYFWAHRDLLYATQKGHKALDGQHKERDAAIEASRQRVEISVRKYLLKKLKEFIGTVALSSVKDVESKIKTAVDDAKDTFESYERAHLEEVALDLILTDDFFRHVHPFIADPMPHSL